MKKKLLLILLTVFSFNTIHAEITWELSYWGVLTISGTDMPDYSATNPAPWLSSYADVKEVVIEEGVTNIGNSAFCYCSNITSVTIPKSVTSIGKYAFYWCNEISEIELPNTLTSIGDCAFYCTGLTSLTIPKSVTSIGDWAFAQCFSLTSVKIPKSVTSIGEMAFNHCVALKSIIVEEGNTKYDSRNNCNAIIEKNSNTLIFGCKNTISPYNVTSIENYAFESHSGLTSIDIPGSVTSIGKKAFRDTGLTSLTIPKSVTSLSMDAFSECKAINSIIVKEGNAKYDSRNKCNAIIETKTNTMILGCNNTVIPNDVTCIGDSALSDCPGLATITIPNSVTEIGKSAFAGCTSLTSITIPKTVKHIGKYAFSHCNLISIIVEEGNKKYDSRNNCNAIIETNSNTLIQGCKSTIIPKNVTSIGNGAFYYCLDLTSIDIPNSVTSIGDEAFGRCWYLTSITLPNSLKTIGNQAFSLSDLQSITIPNSVTSIGDEAFFDCNGIESVVFPKSVKSVGKKAFGSCIGLTHITISSSEISIADDAFDECWLLGDVAILSKTPPALSNVAFEKYTTFHILAGCKAAYEAVEFWKNFTIVEDATTGIDAVDSPATISSNKIFSISGQRLDKAVKGMNIINGKKVMVK